MCLQYSRTEKYLSSLERQEVVKVHGFGQKLASFPSSFGGGGGKAPSCTKVRQVATNCAKLHKFALSCTKLHYVAPIGTKLHQSAQNCIELHQVAPNWINFNLHQVAPICTKLL